MHFTLLKYLKSFTDGRIRIRHPALHNPKTAALVQEKMQATHGVSSITCNTVSGSVLILYDSAVLSKEALIEMGTAWALYLDSIQQGKTAAPPDFS